MVRPSAFYFCFLLLLSYSHAAVAEGLCTSCSNIVFKENKGQWHRNVLYRAEMPNSNVFFERNCITYSLLDSGDMRRLRHDLHREVHYKADLDPVIHCHAFREVFVNASADAKQLPAAKEPDYYNYFIGKNRSRWASHVSAYRDLTYSSIYPGVDLHAYTAGDAIKYDWIIKKGHAADLPVRLRYEGADAVSVSDGRLVIHTSVGSVIESAPYAYQTIRGQKTPVSCHYVYDHGEVTFSLPDGWDHSADLIIDPTLVFSSYSGSTSDNFGYTATYDSKGDAYAAGSVFGTGYPVTVGAFQVTWAGGYVMPPNINFGEDQYGVDIGIIKYNSSGTARLYSTYLGGEGDELPHSMVVNSNDELFVFGTTGSTTFPVTAGAYDTLFNGGSNPGIFFGLAVDYNVGSDIFITHFTQDGSALVGSTYLGGTGNDGLNYPEYQYLNYQYADEVRGVIDIDKNDNVYIATCTRSADFPVTAGAYQTTLNGLMDGTLSKLDNNLSHLIWSTYLGGSDRDAIYSLALDNNNNVFVCGGTNSTDFPTTAGSFQTVTNGGRAEGFITQINQNGSGIIASTLYGTPEYDQLFFVQTDRRNNVYVLGQTFDTTTAFTKNALYNVPKSGQYISKFNYTLDTLIWSTRFGNGRGIPDLSPTAFLVDRCNSVYMSGWGSDFLALFGDGVSLSTQGLYVTPDAYQPHTDGNDFYVMVMKDDASAITYATYFGSSISEDHVDGGTSRFDKKGVIYESVCAGCGGNDSFPTYPANVVSHHNGSHNCNNAIFKMDLDLPLVIADFQQPPHACDTFDYHFTNQSKIFDSTTTTFKWIFDDGTTSAQVNPSHTYTTPGIYTVTLIVTDGSSCNGADTISKQIIISPNDSTVTLAGVSDCPGTSIQIGIPISTDTSIHYSWTPSLGLSDSTISNPYITPLQDTVYRLTETRINCKTYFSQSVHVIHDSISARGSNVLCPHDTIQLSVSDTAGQQLTYTWSPASGIISGGNTDHPLVDPAATTTYYVNAVNTTTGCTYQDSITVSVVSALQNINAVAIPDSIGYGDTSRLHLTYTQPASILWDADSTLSSLTVDSPSAYPTETTTYKVTVTDQNGCRVRDTVTVRVYRTPCASSHIFVPNAFSPNNDGKNDKLFVRGNKISDLYFTVYDRWGQKMFETRDINTGWDGTYHGAIQDPAVFGWYAEGTCESGEKYFRKGNVTLLR
ncbi:MAG: gliding motility-associated C-terminal domain-containing protein [Bacteroidetes bacterium]|nr:gliding motility-associated C-terminal domain-containing protein [Bacteroidota bacterium]